MTADPVTFSGEDGTPYLAVDVIPDDMGGVFLLDSSFLDGPEALAWENDPAAWVNIVCDVTGLRSRRGATRLQGVLTRAEAGTASIDLEDLQRRFDPLVNADAIHRGTPIRMRGWGYLDGGAGDRWDAVIFTGVVDDVLVTYPTEADLPPQILITVVDVVADLVSWKAPGYPDPGVGAGDDLLGRAQRIIAEMGSGTVELSPDVDVQYAATLAATGLAADAWTDLQEAAEAELGRVWVDVHNRLVVRARDSELSGPVRGTLSDVHGEAPLGVHCCFSDPQVALGGEQLANLVLASRRVPRVPGEQPATPPLVVASDTSSRARYRTGRVENQSLELQYDEQVQAWAQAVIVAEGRPRLRVDRVTPAPWGAPEAWPAVLQTDVGDRWLYRQRHAVGPAVSLAVGILGVEHDVTPDRWRVTFHTTEAPEPGVANPSGLFLLDFSEMDGADVLAPFPGPATVVRDMFDGGTARDPQAAIDGGNAGSEYVLTIDGGGAL